MININKLSHFLTSFIFFVFLLNFLTAQSDVIIVHGQVVDKKTGDPIPNVNVYVGEIGTTTDNQGKFTLEVPEGEEMTISMIGYKEKRVLASEQVGTIYLTPTVLKGEEVFVLANRAILGITPVAFSTLSQDEISIHYTVEDVPMILATEPGVYAYSESGNGTGYSYVSIRGFDQSRISVMLDNVPLNDNESHQVYWVDHGDILSDAKDVQIQRGIGSSLYGAAAFGGSINVVTRIATEQPKYDVSTGGGSYGTAKYRIKYSSGKQLGENLSVIGRISQIESEGYRENHQSLQRALFLGLEHRRKRITNQIRVLLGYENTDLMWDGVYGDDINDRKLRRKGYQAYTDDFLQQIYSLNTTARFKGGFSFHNVAYLVKGSGYYEVFKSGRDFYSYNLDVDDQFPDSVEIEMKTDLLRRKWIVNTYYGIAPSWTWKKNPLRLDFGGELRWYVGDHFGEVTDFSDSLLAREFGNEWYKYYDYVGIKRSRSAFVHLIYSLTNRLRLIADFQYQGHGWSLDQEEIGHAVGYQLSANWNFWNPRFGFVYKFNENLSVFGNYGKSQKEPTDDQIIEADDVWGKPVQAAAEVVRDYELGGNYSAKQFLADFNLYRIDYDNEQLKKIDIEQEGEYDYYSADATVHQGIEFEVHYSSSAVLSFGLNGSIGQNIFSSGELKGNSLPNVPGQIVNFTINYRPQHFIGVHADLRYVGAQQVNVENDNDVAIDPFFLLNVGLEASVGPARIGVKVNNLLDTLYVTHGEDWGGGWIAYWPGATRNYFVTLTYSL